MESIKAKATRCLLGSGIITLPTDVYAVKSSGKDWAIHSYADKPELIKLYGLEEIIKTRRGIAVEVGPNSYIILYDPHLSYVERQVTIAHEIAHIDLGHVVSGRVVGMSDDPALNSLQEKEADVFAKYLLAPSCVLANAGIVKPYSIEKAAEITRESAKDIVGDIMELKGYTRTPDEKRLCRQFAGYIRKQKFSVIGTRVVIVVSAVVAAAALFITAYNLNREKPVQQTESIKTDESGYVYTTISGEKFHRSTCTFVIGKENVLKLSIEEATDGGYSPCEVCNPLL